MRRIRNSDYYIERRFALKYGNKPRVCAQEGCDTILNSYNRNDCCSVHNFAYVVKNKIQVGISNFHE